MLSPTLHPGWAQNFVNAVSKSQTQIRWVGTRYNCRIYQLIWILALNQPRLGVNSCIVIEK